ncbi:unnamed protein product [Pieris macdunnoughi]|uniref:Uncharacterized protein n=1 Tax=Pieris macdunnoughi TaxID=345717 RepID=A0A821Y1M5_9NEOP|nr:unnamed protein product [Pieris macdunnoughi]
MKRGRKFSNSIEDQKKAFSPYKNIFTSNNHLPAASDPVYTEIKSVLANPITEKGLYISVQKNFNYFFDIKLIEEQRNSNSIQDDYSDPTQAQASKSINFDFLIDLYKWEKLQPISKRVLVRHNTKSVLKKKYSLPKHMWAHLLREEIWKAMKTPCSWIFKQYSIKNEDRITCRGLCKQCKASLNVVISWPVDKIARCMCSIRNCDASFIHISDKKIKLSPVKRVDMSAELKHEAAIAYRNKISNELMDTGDIEPSHMPTLGCLRQIKHEQRQSSYYDSNQVLSLWMMKLVTPYKEAIKHISLYPFYVFYWTKLQEACCKNLKKLGRIVLSVDATGSIFKGLGPNNKMLVTKHLFLYVLIIKTLQNVSSVPVSQMVSESQTLDTIYQWLQAWRKCNPVPDEVNLDDSSALIGAVVKAFTKYESIAEYVEDSYRRLEDGEVSDTCYIRIDTSHFIKILFNLSCFKHTDTRVKFFYVKCLIELKNCDDYDKAKYIISDLITVCLNQHDGIINGKNATRCENSKRNLKKLCAFHVDDTEIEIQDNDKINANIEESSYSIFDDTLKYNTKQKCPKWIYNKIDAEKIITTLSDDNDCSHHENLYYFPAFIDVLLRLMGQFPLWSNVMKNLYNSDIDRPSSSNIESYFKNLKRLLFQIGSKSQRLRIDEFIIKHLEYFTGELYIVNSNIAQAQRYKVSKKSITPGQKTKTYKMVPQFRDDSVFSDNPSLVENWKGLGMSKTVFDLLKSYLELHQTLKLALKLTLKLGVVIEIT